MNKTVIIAIVAGLFGSANAALATDRGDRDTLQVQKEVFQQRLAQLAAEPTSSSSLEPCINGQVSASGLYPTQAEEDAAISEVQRLGKAMSGRLSASGR